MDRTARRDPKNRDHKMTRDEAVALAPNFYLNRYFAAAGAPSFSELNVTNPDFFKQVNGVLESESLDALKTYVSWHLLDAVRSLAFPAVRGCELQDAAGADRTGGDPSRAGSAASSATDDALGEALGQKYVELTFGADGKQRMLKMVDALEKSLDQDIHDLPWMTRRHQEAGQGQAGCDPQQDRLSRRVARLQFAQDRARRPAGKLPARQRIRSPSARSPRSASRSIARNGA